MISISQRRNVITLYRGKMRYMLQDVGVLLAKANQALSTLERYKSVLEQALTNLSALEFEDLATLTDVDDLPAAGADGLADRPGDRAVRR